ncbi:MAG: L,D-transpeptidase [Nitrospirota bacterium]
MVRGLIKTVFLLIALTVITGCNSAPVPPEVNEAEQQQIDLRKAGAEIYTPQEYAVYIRSLRDGQIHLASANNRFVWFRNYKDIKTEFTTILAQGKVLQGKVDELRRSKSGDVANQIAFFRNKIETLRKLASLINEGRLSSKSLTRAELQLAEVCALSDRGCYSEAEKRLKGISNHTDQAARSILPILNRYADSDEITKWRNWVHETVESSKRNQSYSIIVSKLDKQLILYKAGRAYKTYEIDLGTNGSRDKLYAGDKATPEGKYQIIKKVPASRFHRALLINYPNEDDRRQFASAKKRGLIPRRAGIGGLIEIHGGGKHGMTLGCVAMEDQHIEELFRIVEVGTPVTIVGAIEYENSVTSAMKNL